jgi:hypothetical protein
VEVRTGRMAAGTQTSGMYGWLRFYAGSSLDDQVMRLKKLGIDMRQRSSGDMVKTLMITDPDGDHLAFAEAIEPSMRQVNSSLSHFAFAARLFAQ